MTSAFRGEGNTEYTNTSSESAWKRFLKDESALDGRLRVTAENITDEMILELRQTLGRERVRIGQLLDETYTALFSAAEPDRTHARARIAGILNQRAKESK